MKQTVSFSDFIDAFHSHDRFDQFGYDALKALFEYLEEYEESCGEELELDVIALCCDYTAYPSTADAAKECLSDWTREEDETDEEYEARSLEELENHTTVISYDSGIIVQAF